MRSLVLFDAAPDAGPPLFRDFVRRWLEDKSARLAAGTAYDWQRVVEARLLPTLGDKRVNEIAVDDVEALVAALKRGEVPSPPAPDASDKRRLGRKPMKLSNRRVNIILKVLRQSLDRAVAKGWLESNPARAVDLLREERPDIDPLSLDEVRRMLADGLQHDEERRFFAVALFSGLRPGELIGLQWHDLDWPRKLIAVRRTVSRFGTGPTKTVESRRDVQMLPVVERALSAQRASSRLRGAWIFPNRDGGPLDLTNLRERVWRPAVRRAKLRSRPLYQSRHSFVTLMLGAGESPAWVAQQLGHTSAEMVRRRYSKFIPNLTRQDGSAASRWLAEHGL
jgi:integrase